MRYKELPMLLLKEFKSGSNDLSVKISQELSKGLNFNDPKFKTSEWSLMLSLPVNLFSKVFR